MCIAKSTFIVNGVLSITAPNTTGQCIYAQYLSEVSLIGNGSNIDSTGTCVMSHSGSNVSIPNGITISSNATIGLLASGGTITYRTITNNATTPTKTEYGGRIFTSAQSELESHDLIASGTNLNDIKTSGIYRLRGTYSNAPDNSKWSVGSSNLVGNLLVINPGFAATAESIVQILTISAPFAIFYRTFTGASWYRWSAYAHNTYAALTSADLNSIRDSGIYFIDPTTYTYSLKLPT